MNLKLMTLVGCVGLTAGCITEIRTSSRIQLKAKDSQALVLRGEEDSVRLLSGMFSKRGFQLTDRQQGQGSTLYVFEGSRVPVMSVSGGGETSVSSSTNVVGSVFYVRMAPQDGNTAVDFFGKPTLNGKPVCSDQDVSWLPQCKTTLVGVGWEGLPLVTGEDEAKTLRSILLELELGAPGTSGPLVARPPAREAEPNARPPEPTCYAEQLPEWKTATAVRKKELLEQCRVPKSAAQQAGASVP